MTRLKRREEIAGERMMGRRNAPQRRGMGIGEGRPGAKKHGILFAAVLFALILGPISLVGTRFVGVGPSEAESWAASDRAVVEGEARPRTTGAARGENGSLGSRLTSLEVRQLLASHNRARREVGLGPLTWSNSLAVYAQEWADHLASTSQRMEHRPHSGRWKQAHGENLFMGTIGYYGVTDAVLAWENEKSAYDGRGIDLSSVRVYGHYTQVIWKNTKRIGCAKTECAGNMIVVCNYDPPGNVLGQTPY